MLRDFLTPFQDEVVQSLKYSAAREFIKEHCPVDDVATQAMLKTLVYEVMDDNCYPSEIASREGITAALRAKKDIKTIEFEVFAAFVQNRHNGTTIAIERYRIDTLCTAILDKRSIISNQPSRFKRWLLTLNQQELELQLHRTKVREWQETIMRSIHRRLRIEKLPDRPRSRAQKHIKPTPDDIERYMKGVEREYEKYGMPQPAFPMEFAFDWRMSAQAFNESLHPRSPSDESWRHSQSPTAVGGRSRTPSPPSFDGDIKFSVIEAVDLHNLSPHAVNCPEYRCHEYRSSSRPFAVTEQSRANLERFWQNDRHSFMDCIRQVLLMEYSDNPPMRFLENYCEGCFYDFFREKFWRYRESLPGGSSGRKPPSFHQDILKPITFAKQSQEAQQCIKCSIMNFQLFG